MIDCGRLGSAVHRQQHRAVLVHIVADFGVLLDESVVESLGHVEPHLSNAQTERELTSLGRHLGQCHLRLGLCLGKHPLGAVGSAEGSVLGSSHIGRRDLQLQSLRHQCVHLALCLFPLAVQNFELSIDFVHLGFGDDPFFADWTYALLRCLHVEGVLCHKLLFRSLQLGSSCNRPLLGLYRSGLGLPLRLFRPFGPPCSLLKHRSLRLGLDHALSRRMHSGILRRFLHVGLPLQLLESSLLLHGYLVDGGTVAG
mmetsp:Transcript_5092/g.13238  ORF Transcript_5092/g.13238 Transcript_5092/m.13238 type:complete len:255 (-) Transcript_5092:1487-2251(-)